MTKRVFETVWHSDAGHAWLEVKYVDFLRANLTLYQISPYSRIDPDTLTLYLEGDCDAGVFMKAWEKAGYAFADGGELVCEGDSFVRSLPTLPRLKGVAKTA